MSSTADAAPPVPPPDPALDEARRALDAGDFAMARRLARAALAQLPADGEGAKQARALLAGLGVDRVAALLTVASLVFLAVVLATMLH